MKTTIKLKFRESTAVSGRGVLVLYVTRHRETRSMTTPYKLSASEWDEKRQCFVCDNAVSKKRERELCKMQSWLEKDRRLLEKDMERLGEQDDYTASTLVSRFRLHNHGKTLGEYVKERADALCQSEQIGTARAYETAIKSFLHSRSGLDIALGKLDSSTMMRFEQYLKSKGLKPNSISCYMRSLGAVYNHAVRAEIIPEKKVNPFGKVFTGYAKTEKRALPKNDIVRIQQLDLSPVGVENIPPLRMSHLMFLFSFYTQGMSYVDMVHLTKANIVGNHIVYKRQKTGQTIRVEILPCIRQIIKMYEVKYSPYLFPMLRGTRNAQERWQAVRSGLALMNRQLKIIAREAGITTTLTSYVARHSWASTASSEGIPMRTISRAMGHESERTTAIYVALLDTSDVDKANRRIMNIFNTKGAALNNYAFVE